MRAVGTGPFTRAHIAYITALTMVSAAWLAALLIAEPRLLQHPIQHHVVAFGTFLLLAVASRLMAFSVAGTGSFGLDTSIYVATLLTLGVGPAVVIVVVTMLLRGVVDWVRRALAGTHWPWPVSLARMLFSPLLTGAMISLLGLVASPEAFALRMKSQAFLAVALFVGTSAGFVIPQFSLVILSYRLNGIPWRTLARDVLWPGLLAELAFVPMGFALAFSYRDRDPPTLAAVGVSYVIFAYVFRRMWRSSESLREKARELEVVEEAGRAASSTLDIEEIGRRIGGSLLAAIDRAQGVVLTVVSSEAGAGRHLVRAVDRRHKPGVIAAVRRSLVADLGAAQEQLPDIDPPPTETASTGPVVSIALTGPDGSRAPGWLSVVLRPGTRLRASDESLCERLARQASISVANWRLYTMATEDGLTGLFVRRYVEARVREEFERSSRSGGAFGLLMMDVDNLKTVNDRHGHAAGDRLLHAVAAAIRATVRGMDVPGRWGGDEFALLVPEMGLEEGTAMARRIANEVGLRSFQVGTAMVIPSVSIGVAAYPECSATDPTALVALADKALYIAKGSGSKGRVVAAEATRPPSAARSGGSDAPGLEPSKERIDASET